MEVKRSPGVHAAQHCLLINALQTGFLRNRGKQRRGVVRSGLFEERECEREEIDRCKWRYPDANSGTLM